MADLIKNFAYCKLTAAVDAVVTSLPVDSVSRLPSSAEVQANDFWMTIDEPLALGGHEIIKVTDVLTGFVENGLTSGQNVTGASAFINGDYIVAERFRVTANKGVLAITLTSLTAVAAGTRRVGLASNFTTADAKTSATIPWLTGRSGAPCWTDVTSTVAAPKITLPGVDLVAGTDYMLVVWEQSSSTMNGGATAATTFGGFTSPDRDIIYTADPATAITTSLGGYDFDFTLHEASDSGASLTVLRGQEGTVAAAHGSGRWLKNALTKGILERKVDVPVYLQTILAGTLVAANDVIPPGLRVPKATTARQIICRVGTAPTGANLIVTVERFNNGVSQGLVGTVTIPAGSTNASVTGLSVALATGDILKVNVTQVGSTVAGADLNVSVDCW